MEHFCKYSKILKTFSVMWCIFWIFSPAEGYNISRVVGSNVTLHCKNKSDSPLIQLTWKLNGSILFSFIPEPRTTPFWNQTHRLNISITESHPDILIIESTKEWHTGNYSCERSTAAEGVDKQKWEVIITCDSEHEEAGNSKMLLTIVTITVPLVCFLIFILTLTVLLIRCKQRAGNHSPSEAMEREEYIYENCLVTDNHGLRNYNQHPHDKTRIQ